MSITPIRLPALSAPLEAAGQAKNPAGGFQAVLFDAIGQVNKFQQDSQTAIGKFLSGEDEEVHKVALATQQAELSLDLFLQVRNKVVSAYQEVMRMQM
jgi:flagellar hook-basal body complex protein FliE